MGSSIILYAYIAAPVSTQHARHRLKSELNYEALRSTRKETIDSLLDNGTSLITIATSNEFNASYVTIMETP
jgi:hypothetical protein